MTHVNEAPPGVHVAADPTSAAIGELEPDQSIEEVEAKLVDAGVPADRIHFLIGDGGIAFLDDLGNWFSRLVSQSWHDARDALANGKVLVGVHEVDEVDAAQIRRLLGDSGVQNIRSFGTWTWTD